MTMPDGMDDGMQMLSFPSDMQWQWWGALVKMESVNPGAWWTLAYFSCEDCAVEITRVAAAWWTVTQEKMNIGDYGFMATAMDTEGNMIGFHSMK
jgi:predicted enzyme related to lactoylglutathione lyase